MTEAYLEFADSRVRKLDKQTLSIGRIPENDIVIGDASLSREHAALSFEEGKWHVLDKGSKNKTCVNNVPIEPNIPTPLEEDTDLHFGHYKVRFKLGLPVSENVHDATIQMEVPANIEDVMAGLSPSPQQPRSTASNHPAGQGSLSSHSNALAPENAYAALEPRSTTAAPFYITKRVTRIGSDPRACDIVLEDKLVALEHAEIKFEKKKVKITDLGSKEGTRVNDGRRKKYYFLNDGDKVTIGNSTFSFRLIRYPTESTNGTQKKKSPALYFLMFMLFILIAGMSGYYYYTYIYKQDDDQSRPALRQHPTFSLAGVEDLIRENRFAEASGTLKEIEAQGVPEEHSPTVKAYRRDLEYLSEASIWLRQNSANKAFEQVQRIDPRSPTFDLGRSFIREVESHFHRRLEELKQDAYQAERAGEWDAALDSLRQLRNFSDDPETSVLVEKSMRRIELRKGLIEAYTKQKDTVDDYFATVLKLTQPVLERAEKKMSSNIELRRELDEDFRRLNDLVAHAEFLTIYKNFEGEADQVVLMDAIIADSERLSLAYENRQELQKYRKRVENVMRLIDEYNKLYEEYKGLQNTDIITVEQGEYLVKMIDTLEKIRATLDDPNIPMSRTSAELIKTTQEWLTNTLRNMLESTRAIMGANPIETAMQRREALARLMKLFPPEAYLNAESRENLPLIIKNADQRAVFQKAYDDYKKQGNEVVKSIDGAKLTRSMTREDILDYLRRLKEVSLVQDQDINWRIDTLKKDL